MASGNTERRIGDRREGRLLRTLPAFNKIAPHIMTSRGDSSNYFAGSVEVSDAERYIRQKRAEGYRGMGMLHLFIAAYVRVVSLRPALNRFVSGRHIYARDGVEVVMTLKKPLSSESEETTVKIRLETSDTMHDVYRKVNARVDAAKAGDKYSDAERTADRLSALPGPLLKFTLWALRVMDYFDILPGSMLDASPYHGSLIITDLGSLGIPPVYRHLYNSGNVPVSLAFGAKRRAVELDSTGTPVERKYIDFTLTMDERICDGYYYAAAVKYLRYYLHNPHLLDEPPESVAEDIL